MNVIDISTSSFHSLACTDEGTVYGWGCNRNGELALPNKDKIFNKPVILPPLSKYLIVKVSCGNDHSLALSNNNMLYNIYSNFINNSLD